MKVGAYTPSVRLAVAVRPPDTPVIVSGYCPITAALLAVNVNWLFPVVGFGAMLALTPPGKPEMLRLTGFVNP